MRKRKKLDGAITMDELFEKEMRRPAFKKAWEEQYPQYQLTRALIRSRIEKKMSQKELAKRAGTTQAVLSRVENMNANPSIKFLQKLAKALDKKLVIEFR